VVEIHRLASSPLYCPRGHPLRPGHTLAMVSALVGLLAIQAADATGEAANMNASTRRVRQRRGVRRQRLVRWRRCHHAATDGEYKRGCTAGQRECGPSSHFHFVFSSGFTFSFADQLSTVVLSDPRRTQKLARSGPAYSRSAYPRVGSIAC
jgi:hypothetical protein